MNNINEQLGYEANSVEADSNTIPPNTPVNVLPQCCPPIQENQKHSTALPTEIAVNSSSSAHLNFVVVANNLRGYAICLVQSMRLSVEWKDLVQEVCMKLCRCQTAAVARVARKSLRNCAISCMRSEASRRKLAQKAQVRTPSLSQEAEQAKDMIDTVRPKLSPLGQLALDVALNEIHLEDYAREAGCGVEDAKGHFLAGLSELARLLRQEGDRRGYTFPRRLFVARVAERLRKKVIT